MTVRFGPFEFALPTGDIRRGDALLNLDDRERDLLKALLEKPGTTVSRDELKKALWPNGSHPQLNQDAAINTAMATLRDKLADDARQPRYIETLHARGYRFIAQVETVLAKLKINFDAIIEAKTRFYVGRQWIIERLDAFIAEQPCGYIIIIGDPGIGKTSFAASLVANRRCIHHFNDSTLGVVSLEQFIGNISAQLFERYAPKSPAEGIEAGAGAYLLHLFRDILTARAGEKIVIVVDALDEASLPVSLSGNVLGLPPLLPQGVFFVLTMRNREHFPLTVQATTLEIPILADSQENMGDIRAFLELAASRPELRGRLAEARVRTRDFVLLLEERSEGNFMYLFHVLPAIERGDYPQLRIDTLPRGLMGYYERHFRQMRGQNPVRWVSTLLPVVGVLAAAREPLSLAEISGILKEDYAEFGRLTKSEVGTVISEWREFLSQEVIGGTSCYRIYHTTFRDFLEEQHDLEGLNG